MTTPTHPDLRLPIQMRYEHDDTGYPCFYIQGLSGDMKRDDQLLMEYLELIVTAVNNHARLMEENRVMQEALERLTLVSNLISARLHVLGKDMGFAGQYDGNYPCSAHHVELDHAIHQAETALALAGAP